MKIRCSLVIGIKREPMMKRRLRRFTGYPEAQNGDAVGNIQRVGTGIGGEGGGISARNGDGRGDMRHGIWGKVFGWSVMGENGDEA
jgi:hypothetical protein